MKVKNKTTSTIGYSNKFNIHAISEIIVTFKEGDCSSEFISDYEVQLKTGEFKDMSTAFKDKDLISDNYNTEFREPINTEEFKRGWY